MVINFSTLCPTWNNILRNKWKKLKRNEKLKLFAELRGWPSCLIGEIYGWRDPYSRFSVENDKKYCLTCEFISWQIAHSIINGPDLILDEALLDEKEKIFVNHWLDAHVKKVVMVQVKT